MTTIQELAERVEALEKAVAQVNLHYTAPKPKPTSTGKAAKKD